MDKVDTQVDLRATIAIQFEYLAIHGGYNDEKNEQNQREIQEL